MQIKDALEFLFTKGRESTAATFVSYPEDPRRKLLVHGDHRETVSVPRPLRNETFETAEHLILAAVKRVEEYDEVRPIIWHDDDGIYLVYDDRDARDRASYKLERTKVWAAVESLASGTALTQAALISLLRVTFGEQAPRDLLDLIRRVKFSRGEQTTSEITHAEHSLGKSIELACSGADQLPDRFDVRTAPYIGPVNTVYPVPIALDVLHAKQAFQLQVIGDAVAIIRQEYQRSLNEWILRTIDEAAEDDRILVYHGRP